MMRRRHFITLLGSAAAAWPLAAQAQQRERMRRVGVLLPATADDAHYQAWFGAFLQGLEPLGWRAVVAFAGVPNGGMIVTSSGWMLVHRNLIVELVAQHRLPAIYFERRFVADGGLISYDPDQIDQFRRAADYVDRILKGEKPADLPVQAPTKYELVINLKTAKALGLTVPDSLLARADEVIE